MCDWTAGQGVALYERPMRRAKAICVRSGDGRGAIALDTRRLGSEAQRRCALAHELGHLATGAVYGANARRSEISRAEFRAKEWAARALLPPGELGRAVREGCTEAWELAERFDLTEEMVRFAVELYRGDPAAGGAAV